MQIQSPHSWNVDTRQARRLQMELRARLTFKPLSHFKRIAGVDVSYNKGDEIAYAAVVIIQLPGLDLVEVACAKARMTFPYIPGYLSFREIPIALEAFKKLQTKPDVVICDGHGIAHPRYFGIACHLGILLNVPTLGCAKSKLVGEFGELDEERGEQTPLMLKDKQVGVVLRTRAKIKPVYVSPGHLIDLKSAVEVVELCVSKYRLPEPTRRAHNEVNAFRRREMSRFDI